MDVGIALPTMCRGYDRSSTVDWCRLADAGPFSSISAGERMTFHNPEMWTTLAAAAALTERLRILVNVSVLPAHPPGLVAKQVATLDVLSEGRVTLGVGVGARPNDYASLDAGFSRRHQRLDDSVATLRALWAGEPLFGEPIGPQCVQRGGPPLLAGALGPKSLARAAAWADGVASFSVGGSGAELAWAADAARSAWSAAGRDRPRLVSGCFYVLGVPDSAAVLREFASDYLAFLGAENARRAAETLVAFDAAAVGRILDDAEAAGFDEFVLVPGTTDLRALESTIDVLDARK